MNYQETTKYIFDKLPMFHRLGKTAYKNDLSNSLALDKHFGQPHKNYPCIHIAGTNGKGSVSNFLASILQCAGYRVGLFTSPHLKDFRERIRVNGEMISEDAVVSFVEENRSLFEQLQLSFFEMNTALAFKHFADSQVDIAVIETGLGGRLDSTNIITPILSIITNIGLDHTDILGGTLEKIASEKAGIIKSNVPVVIGESNPSTFHIFQKKAAEMNAPIYFADQEYKTEYSFFTIDQKQSFDISQNGTLLYEDLRTDLMGLYQKKNILTVVQAFDLLNKMEITITKDSLYRGCNEIVANTGLMGRWQQIQQHPLIVCDTGHNEDGIRAVAEQFNVIPYKKLHIVFGVVKDKKIDEMLMLLPKNAVYYFTNANIPRALDCIALQERASLYGLKGEAFPSVVAAFEAAKAAAAPNDMVFVGGSNFVVAEIL
jgi:dihydrofolate synthase / folylpolyglutamate synthase